MQIEPRWITAAEVIWLNRLLVNASGEDHIILHQHLVESAVARPRNLFVYENITDIVELGVRLIQAVGCNHCFAQGNKRTAFHAGIGFIIANGIYPRLVDSEETADLVTAVIIGRLPALELVNLIKSAREIDPEPGSR